MRRSLLRLGSLCQKRPLATNAATAAEVPDDPDILTTQDPSFNPAPEESTQMSDPSTQSGQLFPRLQYRSPPLGVNPAFDLALNLIKHDKTLTSKKLASTNSKIKRLEAAEPDALRQQQILTLKGHRRTLEEFLYLNDPEVHWRHAHGDVDLSMPIYRLLARRSWAERQLLLIEQRVSQMSVTPDVLPPFDITSDVRLQFPARSSGPRKGAFEVGEKLSSEESEVPPAIEIQSFGAEAKRYTIAIIDPDVPDEARDSFKTYLHYLHKDVQLSPTQHKVESSNGNIVHNYVPPHPHKGTPYHRYTVIVWEQPDTPPASAAEKTEQREFFNAAGYTHRNGLIPVGINFWRQVWDANVKNVMTKHPEVKYVEKNFKRIKA